MKAKIIGIAIVFWGALLTFLVLGVDDQSPSQKDITKAFHETIGLADVSNTISVTKSNPSVKYYSRKTSGWQSSQNNASYASFSTSTAMKSGSEINRGVFVPILGFKSHSSTSGNRSTAYKENDMQSGTSLSASNLFLSLQAMSSNDATRGLLASNGSNPNTPEVNQETGGRMNAPTGGEEGGEFPPPEGSPVGGGFWVLIGAVFVYGIRRQILHSKMKL